MEGSESIRSESDGFQAGWQSFTTGTAANQILRAPEPGRVAQLYLTGQFRERDIAAKLDVSEPTVSRDLAYMRELWKEEALLATEQLMKRELRKLDQLEQTAIEGLKETGQVRDFCDVMLKAMKRRSELLGLDKAKRVEVSGEDGEPINVRHLSDEELERIIRGEPL